MSGCQHLGRAGRSGTSYRIDWAQILEQWTFWYYIEKYIHVCICTPPVDFDHDQAERKNRIRLSVLSILWQRYVFACAGKVLLSACTDLLIFLSGLCGPPLYWIQQPITRTTMQLSGFNHCFFFFCHRVKNAFCTFTYSSVFSTMTRKILTALESFLFSSNHRQPFISK